MRNNNIEALINMYKTRKASYDKQSSWLWWLNNSDKPELMVYQINERTKKMSLRADDETPSVAVYSGLSYMDFGGDSRLRDPVDRIMETTGLSFIEAIKLFLTWENINIDDEILEYQVPKPVVYITKEKKQYKAPYNDKFIQDRIMDRLKFPSIYNPLREGLFRSCSIEEMERAEALFSIGLFISKDPEWSHRIFIPEFDEKGQAWGHYLYNREAEPKGLLRKDAKRVLFGSHLVSRYGDNIIYNEGHSDVLVNVAKGLAAVSTGSATKRLSEEYLEILAGKTLHDFPDLDIPGILGATQRALDILEWNQKNPNKKINHKIYLWSSMFYSEKIAKRIMEHTVSKSEPYYPFIRYIPLKKGKTTTAAIFDIKIMFLIQRDWAEKRNINLPKELLVSNWKVLSKKLKKGGYDMIDFHNENQNSPKYNKFLTLFKF